jgi:hypothetical protein
MTGRWKWLPATWIWTGVAIEVCLPHGAFRQAWVYTVIGTGSLLLAVHMIVLAYRGKR